MGFRSNAIATIWDVDPKERFTKVRLNVSRKNRDTGEYEQDFSGFVMMVGAANAKAQRLKERDRIRLGDVDVTTTYNKEQQKEYVNYKCFDFEMADEYFSRMAQNGGSARGNARSTAAMDGGPESGPDPDDEEELPF